MKNRGTQTTMLHVLLADEISGIMQYVSWSETCDTSDHAELHKAILKIHNEFPSWLQQRIASLDQASVASAMKEGSHL